MFLALCLIIPSLLFGETTETAEDSYGNSRFGGGFGEAFPSLPSDPDTEVKPYTPEDPLFGGQGLRFESIPKRHQDAPIFPKFKLVFGDCAPLGCDTGRGHTHGTRGRASCHTTGDAIDLHSIRCNGKEYDSNHSLFLQLIQCIRTRFYEGRRWKVIHQEHTGKCSGTGPNTKNSKVTSCHWDHAHISVGCYRNGRRMW